MKRMITALAGFGFLLFSIAGYSTMVKANYSVDASAADPGLKIQTAEVADNPFTRRKVAMRWMNMPLTLP